MPFRLDFDCLGSASEEVLRNNAAASAHVKRVERQPLHDRPLAIVGGGPSIKKCLDEIINWPGDVWGINQTASWLVAQGRKDAVLFSCDPNPIISMWSEGVERALLADSCDPKSFAAFENVLAFELDEVIGGPATATRAPLLALKLGYKQIVFFGCEGHLEEYTHAYRDEKALGIYDYQILIKAGDSIYRTTPQFYMTTVNLVTLISEFPSFMSEKSGGLLRAMIAHNDTWEVIGYSEALKNQIDPDAKPLEV